MLPSIRSEQTDVTHSSYITYYLHASTRVCEEKHTLRMLPSIRSEQTDVTHSSYITYYLHASTLIVAIW
jgi:hypothetical protein